MKLGEASSTNKAGIHETRAKILSAIQSSISTLTPRSYPEVPALVFMAPSGQRPLARWSGRRTRGAARVSVQQRRRYARRKASSRCKLKIASRSFGAIDVVPMRKNAVVERKGSDVLLTQSLAPDCPSRHDHNALSALPLMVSVSRTRSSSNVTLSTLKIVIPILAPRFCALPGSADS